MSMDDEAGVRAAIAVASRARANSNLPFGAVLADGSGEPVLEAENTVLADRDPTAHAELNLVREASRRIPAEDMGSCSIYVSASPCPMCAGAVYWSGASRLVYGLDEDTLLSITGGAERSPALIMPCRDILGRATRRIEVVGPLLAEEALAPHRGFWD